MFPDYSPEASPDPMAQRSQPVERFGYPVIVPPAVHEYFQFAYYLGDTAPAFTACDFSYPLLEPLNRFPVNTDFHGSYLP